MSSHTAASTSAASPHLTAIASIIAPLTASLASESTVAAIIAPASTLTSTLAPASLTLVPAVIASIVAPLNASLASLASESTVSAIIAPASALSSPATALVHPWATSIAASSSSHAAPVWRVTGIGSRLLDLHLVSSNVTGALLNQLLCDTLLLEGYEAEVLVYWPPRNLTDGSEQTEVILDLVLAHPGVGELTHINLSGLDTCLLHRDTFILQQ